MTSKMKKSLLLIPVLVAVFLPATAAQTAPTPPTGLSAIALDGKVSLAWQSTAGATSYKVYRGTSAASITTLVGSPTTTTFSDAASTNGTTYYYAVRAGNGTGDSAASTSVQAKPQPRTCSTGNAVRVENCFPGTTAWKLTSPERAYTGGIEGFSSATSVNAGSSVDLKVNADDNVPYHMEIYRMGWYGGSHARLVSVLPGLRGVSQDNCNSDDSTGLVDCSNWTTTSTLTTSSDWPSGVYWIRLALDNGSADNSMLLVVRNDASHSPGLVELPLATYQAYNNYGGKSLYDFNSSGPNTVAGSARAVKVSYDRPISQPSYYQNAFNDQDTAVVGFLERQGYDLSYITSVDLETTTGAALANHKAVISTAHDEYWSSAMRTNVTQARDLGTGLFFMGSNEMYWRIRHEASPFSGTQNRVVVAYKSTQGGAKDPVSPTGTWRDPAGINQPENALVGQMYVGDNDSQAFPMVVSAGQGKTRVWRHTDLASQTAGASASLGAQLVGWEWDARVANGKEPAGVQSFTGSPVTGELIQGNGASYIPGSTTAAGTIYRAASGAYVASTGTNYWSRGLDTNAQGSGEPDLDVQQATTNILSDMGTAPTTPIAGITVDQQGAPVVTSKVPAASATGVPIGAPLTATFDRPLDPATVTASTFTLKRSDGTSVAATVTYDDTTHTVTLTPTGALNPFATYTARLVGGSAGIAAWGGALAADVTWSFTTGSGTPPKVTSTDPASGATGVTVGSSIKATFDRDLDPTTVTAQNFTVKDSSGTAATGTVSYDSASRTATFTPNPQLSSGTTYTATIATAIKATDGTAMASPQTWSFTTAIAPTVTSRVPAPLASGVSPGALVRAVFSRAIDPTTITAQTFTLTAPNGQVVPATVTYDATTTSASLVPASQLLLGSVYTAKLTTGVTDTAGTPLTAAVTWTFTTSATQPTAPSVTAAAPADTSTGVSLDSTVTATFDRAIDPTTVTGQSFTLADSTGVAVSAAVSYDGAGTATLRPTANLAPGKVYTATLTTAIRAVDGTPLASTVRWTFTTANCPCSMMGSSTPASTGLDVRDGRGGAGPWTYELGTKFTVDAGTQMVAVRYYKDPGETGTHVGRVWNSAGTQVASTTFQNETASGWQRQALSTPLALTAGQIYTVSVGLNTRFVMTGAGLATPLNSGPLHSVQGGNGVFANAAGTFPTTSWNNSNYFVDALVTPTGVAKTPQVTARTPVAGATGVAAGTTVTATFSTAMDSSTVNSSTFLLQDAGGATVPATVTYNTASRTATLTPAGALATGAAYTARLTTGLRSDDETPLPAAVTWSFSTSSVAPPGVVSTSPADTATLVSPGSPVEATFSASLDPASVTAQTFTVTGPGGTAVSGSVGYTDATKTVRFTPSSPLASSSTYTATLTTGITGASGLHLARTVTWQFSTSTCPCSLFTPSMAPASQGNPTQDGRSGPGPWTYELGVKIKTTQTTTLTAVRYYKDPTETGTHIGRIWAADGTPIASVTFANESASGWQQQALTTPITLSAGTTYVVSVGYNAAFGTETGGLNAPYITGPLASVADGANGVYATAAGTFPSSSWRNSNYYVDVVVQ